MFFQSLASSMIRAALKISLLYKIVSLCTYNQVHTTLACSLNLIFVTKPVSKIKYDNRHPSPQTKAASVQLPLHQLNSLQLSNLPTIFPISCCCDWIHPVCIILFPFQIPAKFNNSCKWKLNYWLQWSCSCLEQGWIWPVLPITRHRISNKL